jgi:flagellar assembly protein FliH
MTATQPSGSARPSTVLRGVSLHGQPHALARPGRVHPEAAARTPHMASAHAVHDAAAVNIVPDTQTAFEAGLAEGRKQGYETATTQAAEQARAREMELTELRVLAAAEGREEGLARGREEGLFAASQAQAHAIEQLDRTAADRLDRLDQLLKSLVLERARRLEEAEEDIVAFSHEVVCRILGAQAAQPECVRAMVTHLLAQDGQRAELAVHVHPDDLAALMDEGGETPWQWIGDRAVQLGGVVLRSPEGSLDARLETQLAALRDALLDSRRDRKSASLPQPPEATPAGEGAA